MPKFLTVFLFSLLLPLFGTNAYSAYLKCGGFNIQSETDREIIEARKSKPVSAFEVKIAEECSAGFGKSVSGKVNYANLKNYVENVYLVEESKRVISSRGVGIVKSLSNGVSSYSYTVIEPRTGCRIGKKISIYERSGLLYFAAHANDIKYCKKDNHNLIRWTNFTYQIVPSYDRNSVKFNVVTEIVVKKVNKFAAFFGDFRSKVINEAGKTHTYYVGVFSDILDNFIGN